MERKIGRVFRAQVQVIENESAFFPKLKSKLGEGGQAKVFKATFHQKCVAMKYVPLDHIKDNFLFEPNTYGCHEYWHQEKLMTRSIQKFTQKTF